MQSDCKIDSVDTKPNATLDRVGIGVSIACAIHCVGAALLAASPAFAASLVPSLGESLEWAETAFLWMALGVGLVALLPAYLREHRKPLPLVLFVTGIGLVALGHVLELAGAEIAGTVTGVAAVSTAHFLNLRARGHHAHAGHAH